MLIVDIPPDVRRLDQMQTWLADNDSLRHPNAAVYFPRTNVPDPLNHNRPRSHRRAAARSPVSRRAPTRSAACGRRRPAPMRGCATSTAWPTC